MMYTLGDREWYFHGLNNGILQFFRNGDDPNDMVGYNAHISPYDVDRAFHPLELPGLNIERYFENGEVELKLIEPYQERVYSYILGYAGDEKLWVKL